MRQRKDELRRQEQTRLEREAMAAGIVNGVNADDYAVGYSYPNEVHQPMGGAWTAIRPRVRLPELPEPMPTLTMTEEEVDF